jgi:hypothetical protein
LAAKSGIVEPQLVKVVLQLDPQHVRPGLVCGDFQTLGGAAAHRHHGQPVSEILGRLRTLKTQGIIMMHYQGVDFGAVIVMYYLGFINRQYYIVAFNSKSQGIVEPQGNFTDTQRQN